jgi:hypothetical protein
MKVFFLKPTELIKTVFVYVRNEKWKGNVGPVKLIKGLFVSVSKLNDEK